MYHVSPVTSNFAEGNFLDKDCDITWNCSPFEMDGSSSDYWNLGSDEMSDFALEGPYLKKKMYIIWNSLTYSGFDSCKLFD